MALERKQSEFTYSSSVGEEVYYFTIVYINSDSVSVRDIKTPYGQIQNPYSTVPHSVVVDMRTATLQVLEIMSSSASNGILTFTAETSKAVTFTTPMDDTTYRVVLSIEDFIPARVTSKTVSGFTIEVGITYTGSVGYDVFV